MNVKVLFVCVHNSGRSQMAEAFTRALSGGAVNARSAGTLPGSTLNPVVTQAMEERSIPLTGHYPKVIDQQMVDEADYAYTMGCAIDEACPAVFVPSEDWGLDDPAGQPIERVRRIRDEVEVRVRAMLDSMGITPTD
ncbi:MAG: arsenate reductase ArsC [Chloroflexi bacterium]|nr:arsenate reductase ArsC [Chloroflexota bacterium]